MVAPGALCRAWAELGPWAVQACAVHVAAPVSYHLAYAALQRAGTASVRPGSETASFPFKLPIVRFIY